MELEHNMNITITHWSRLRSALCHAVTSTKGTSLIQMRSVLKRAAGFGKDVGGNITVGIYVWKFVPPRTQILIECLVVIEHSVHQEGIR